MIDSNKLQQIEALRSQVLEELVPLVEQGTYEPLQKFDLFLAIARSSDDPERYTKAFNAAKDLPTTEDKTAALFDLLDAMEDATAVASFDESTEAETPLQ